MKKIFLIICLFSFQSFAELSCEEISGVNDEEKEDFFFTLKTDLEKDLREDFASKISYPIQIKFDNSIHDINNENDFLDNYDKIVNNQVKDAILNNQLDDLFCNYHGVSIGNGIVWFELMTDSNILKITQININY